MTLHTEGSYCSPRSPLLFVSDGFCYNLKIKVAPAGSCAVKPWFPAAPAGFGGWGKLQKIEPSYRMMVTGDMSFGYILPYVFLKQSLCLCVCVCVCLSACLPIPTPSPCSLATMT